MLSIKNNMMASNAARHLGSAYDSLATSVERLSSGLRINSAKDDAAGLAVRELMRAEIAVLGQGTRNAQDGISMMQTMEGAMAVIDENLVRMKELAEQAATGSYSDDQRTIMNNEFAEMAEEIDRIAASTSFNGNVLLSALGQNVDIHVGTTEVIGINAQNMTTSSQGLNIAVGTAGYQAISDHGVDDVADTWLTLTDSDAGNGTLKLDIAFDGEEAIQVTFTGTASDTKNFSLTEVVEAINTVSLNQAVSGDGTVNAYSMASVEHDNTTGKNFLKLSSRTSDAASATITGTTVANLVATGGVALVAGQTAADVTEASGANATDNGKMVKAAGTGISIDTATNATAALARLTTAITTKDAARAEFGYKMNRLESTVSILEIQKENLQTAESRISDVDVATEMAEMTRTQVLAQAGVSMLSQANSMPQMALSLLR